MTRMRNTPRPFSNWRAMTTRGQTISHRLAFILLPPGSAGRGVTGDDTDGSDTGILHDRGVVARTAAPFSDAVAGSDGDRGGLSGLDSAAAGGLVPAADDDAWLARVRA